MAKLFFAALCCVVLTSCSSSSSTPDNPEGTTDIEDNMENTVLTGVFLDSAVEGVSYRTETVSGITNALGEYNYSDGESVTFFIGSLNFPEVEAQAEISPVDMSPTESIDDNVTVNIARLLQSMDVDNNPSNGITISDVASASAVALDFSQTPSDFSNNTDVINLVANSGSSSTALLAPEVAIAHLSNTLGMAGFIRIVTLETFNAEIVDRVMLLENGDRVVVTSDNTIELLNDEGASVIGTWTWENSLFCREVLASTGAPVFDCQLFEINGDQLRFTRDAGAGETVRFTLEN